MLNKISKVLFIGMTLWVDKVKVRRSKSLNILL